jgi:hypothetical protein
MISRFHACALVCAALAVAAGCTSQPASQRTVPDAAVRHVRTGFITPPYEKAVLALSPYAYYRLDELSGTTAYDSSGNGRDGTYEGTSGTHYLLGQSPIIPDFTHAAMFYSANPGQPKVSIPSVTLGWNGSVWQSDFTVALWAKPDPSELSQSNDMVDINNYYVGQGSSAGAAGTYAYMGAYPVSNWFSGSGPNFGDGNSHFVALTVHENASGYCDLYLYTDATLSTSATWTRCTGATGILSSTNAGIGARVDYTSGFAGYFGEISGVAIFSRALSATEISNLYNGATPAPSPTPTPTPTP